MPLTPQIDALTAQIHDLNDLAAALDGVQPIAVTVGGHTLTVDPANQPDSYARGADAIRQVIGGTVVRLKEAIAEAAISSS